MTPAQTVIDTIRTLAFGPDVRFENLTMRPILAADDRPPEYLTLDDALERGAVQITEIGEAGRVPELKVIVKGDLPVLLMDGEELVGAKQNRVLNLTILAPPQKTTIIPVSCVEADRWRQATRRFATAGRMQFAEGRAAKVAQVTSSLKAAAGPASDQLAVWDLIADKSARLQAQSETSAMSALFEMVQMPIESFVKALPPVERQVGALFLIDGRPVGLDLFDRPATWRKLSPKLIGSYAVDAIDRQRYPRPDAGVADPAAFLASVSASTASAFPGTGEGDDVRLSGDGVEGAALVARGRAIHVSAFAVAAE